MANDWSQIEVDLIVADYFSMLNDELVGRPYNKTEHRKQLSKLLSNRSDGSIEFKHQNISAVLIKLGLPFIRGYKPLGNYQQILEDRTIAYLAAQKNKIEPNFELFSEVIPTLASPPDFSKAIEAPPENHIISEPEFEHFRRPIKINYLQREQNNMSLGVLGETFALAYEKWLLNSKGKANLADKVEWISQTDDGAGFDILSKNIDGTDKYIEVKTTKLTKETPIFFSKNEYECSLDKNQNYHLYRIFNFSQTPKMFCVNGNFDSFCTKEAIQYKGRF